jgi:hypothetical protein
LTDNVEESRQLAEKCRDLGSVAMVEDISLYLPSEQKQLRRMTHIEEIKKSISSAKILAGLRPENFKEIIRELERLDMNVKELQDMAYLGGQDKVEKKCQKIVGNPDDPNSRDIILELVEKLKSSPEQNRQQLSSMQKIFAPYYKQTVLQMCNTSTISLADMPESILDRYANKSRTQFLVSVFPAGSLWTNSEFLKKFVDDLETVTDKATGMGPVFRALVEIIGRDGKIAMMLTLVIVYFLLWIDFKHARDALLAMIPLGVGVLWMIGLMRLTGQQLTVMNVMGLPMILGIGIDDGVHILHRWRSESKKELAIVFASTGKAILLTSLTTMLAFGSLIFSIWRGFGQLGAALFVGVGACFLTTVIILSGILGLITHRNK